VSSIAVLGPLADSRRDTLGPWVFDFDLAETVTVLDGIRRAAGDRVRVDYARGIPVGQRTFPSMFDMFGGNAPTDPADFDPSKSFAHAVELATAADVAVVVVGEWQKHDRRGGVPVVARTSGPATRARAGGGGDRYPRPSCW